VFSACLVSSVLSCFVFIKMFNNGLLTNFVVVHTVWILLVLDAYYISLLCFYYTHTCHFWYVSLK
jgi:hypothetical protein